MNIIIYTAWQTNTEPQTKIFSLNNDSTSTLDFMKSLFLLYRATSDLQSAITFSDWTWEMLAVSNTSSMLAVYNDDVYLQYTVKQNTRTCLTLCYWWETYCELRNEQNGQASHTGCNPVCHTKQRPLSQELQKKYPTWMRIPQAATLSQQISIRCLIQIITMFTVSHIMLHLSPPNICTHFII
jgi:hypothetical protein